MRLRWDRISLLLFTIVAAVVATVMTANADDGAPKPHPAAVSKTALVKAAKPATPATPSVGPLSTADPVSTAGPGGCPAVGDPLSTAPGTGRTVALTFDDGPGVWTPQVLRVLHDKHVPASFFMIGKQAAAEPGLVREVAAQGHLIGDHTWSHRPPSAAAGWIAASLTTELNRTNNALKAVTGAGTCWFRPPEGIVKGAPAVASGLGMRLALWSVDTEDWKVEKGSGNDPTARLSRRIAMNAVAGASLDHPVILMHDGGGYRGATVAALGAIIDFYRANGYTFVRLDGR